MRTPDWQSDDGAIQLHCCDCLDLLPTIPAGAVDAVVTDPPYGIDYSSGHGGESWGDGSVAGDGSTFARDSALDLVRGVSGFVFGSWRIARPTCARMLLVWDTLGALGMGDLRIPFKPSHQEIYVVGNPLGFCGDRTSDVIQHPPVQSMAKNGRLHPMEKPVGLICLLLLKLKGETIIDPFMGSGTTAIACIRTGRRFIGCEIEPRYFDIAVRRIKAELAQPRLFTAPEPMQKQETMFQ